MQTSIITWRDIQEGNSHDCYLLIKLDSSDAKNTTLRKPIHLALVLDKSASMGGAKLDLTKEAAIHFINLLTRRDYFSLVAYNSTAEVIYPHTALNNKASVAIEISQIEAKNNTNLSGGWLLGLGELHNHFDNQHMHCVILLTDGLANEGVTNTEQLVSIGQKYYSRKIRTTTMGFGNDFDEDLLKNIADKAGGRFYFIKDPEDIGKAFQNEFGELSNIIGQNLAIQFNAAPEISILESLSDYPGDIEKSSAKLQLGDIQKEDIKTVLLRIEIPAALSTNAPLGSLTVSYASVVGDMEIHKHTLDVQLDENPDEARNIANNNEVKQELWLIQSPRVKLEALGYAREGLNTEAYAIIEQHLSRYLELDLGRNTILEQEKSRLTKFMDNLSTENADTIRKSLVHDAYSMRQNRGEYVKTPGVFIIDERLSKQQPEMRLELEAKLFSFLADYEYEEDSIAEIRTVMNELIKNAFEHGCKDRPDGEIVVLLRITPIYVLIQVKDPGPGFDYKKVMAHIDQEKAEIKERGFGLSIVKALTLNLSFSDSGSCVKTVFQKDKLSVASSIAQERDGVFFMDDIVVIKFSGRLDWENSSTMKTEIERLISHSYVRIIIDMSQTDFIDSAALGALVWIKTKIDTYDDGALVFACLPNAIRQILDITLLSSALEITDTIDDAIQYLRD